MLRRALFVLVLVSSVLVIVIGSCLCSKSLVLIKAGAELLLSQDGSIRKTVC